jgi:LPS-assembly lipoprotein
LKTFTVISFLVCLSITVAGCSGWRLRGSETDDSTLSGHTSSVYLSGRPGQTYSYIEKRLNRQNRLTPFDSSDLHLIINSENFKRRTASLAGNAIAAEFELSLTVNYSILNRENKIIRANLVARVDRSYTFDQNDIAGKDKEEKLIRRDMVRNAGRQILQQLQFIKPQS